MEGSSFNPTDRFHKTITSSDARRKALASTFPCRHIPCPRGKLIGRSAPGAVLGRERRIGLVAPVTVSLQQHEGLVASAAVSTPAARAAGSVVAVVPPGAL
jgi:hypothetical protein